MTIYDISQKTGVSIATVSRVLNGKKGVGHVTRQRVLTAMEESGYTPNAFARGMGLGSIQTVGILCTDISDLYQAAAVSVLERELRTHNYEAVLSCTGPEEHEANLRMLLSKQVDAVILVGSHFLSGDCSYICQMAAHTPIILINGYLKADNVYCLLCDEYTLMNRITASLLEKGRRELLYLYDRATYSGRQKLAGYKAALTEAGLDAASTYLQCPRDLDRVAELLSSLTQSGRRFDAIVCSEDELGVGVLKYARSLGVDIPGQLDVVGCNNSILARTAVPELTSADNRVGLLCTMAIATLFGVLKGDDYPNRILISGELVTRQSADIQI